MIRPGTCSPDRARQRAASRGPLIASVTVANGGAAITQNPFNTLTPLDTATWPVPVVVTNPSASSRLLW
jgi:hypothetical protein